MFRSKPNFNRGLQAFAGAFILAMMFAGILGITRAHAAAAATNLPGMASHTDSNLCAAGLQSSDYYLRQEDGVLRLAMQGNWNAAEMASPSSSICAVEMHSSDYYLRQEEAVLRIVTQNNWNTAEIASFGGDNFIAQARR